MFVKAFTLFKMWLNVEKEFCGIEQKSYYLTSIYFTRLECPFCQIET